MQNVLEPSFSLAFNAKNEAPLRTTLKKKSSSLWSCTIFLNSNLSIQFSSFATINFSHFSLGAIDIFCHHRKFTLCTGNNHEMWCDNPNVSRKTKILLQSIKQRTCDEKWLVFSRFEILLTYDRSWKSQIFKIGSTARSTVIYHLYLYGNRPGHVSFMKLHVKIDRTYS